MKKIVIINIIFTLLFSSKNSYSFHGVSHEGITNSAESQREILKDYLYNIGFSKDRETPFTLSPNDYWVPDGAYTGRFVESLQSDPYNLLTFATAMDYDMDGRRTDFTSSASAMNWLLLGSILEDVPLMDRAVHHFHDPTNLHGLFDFFTGVSARYRAFDDPSMDFGWTANNPENIRSFQYKALTSTTKEERSHYWALTLFGVGTVVHLLEDMAVPEHVRNDWTYGHARNEIREKWDYDERKKLPDYRYLFFEIYIDQVFGQGVTRDPAVGKGVCGFDSMISANPVTFDERRDLWDVNETVPGDNDFDGTYENWGLAQFTNHYFFSNKDEDPDRRNMPFAGGEPLDYVRPYKYPYQASGFATWEEVTLNNQPAERIFYCGVVAGEQGNDYNYALAAVPVSDILVEKFGDRVLRLRFALLKY